MRAETLSFAASAADARRFFARDDVRATIPTTVLDALGAGAAFGDVAPELFRVVDDDGRAVFFALRTPPHPLVLALGPIEAAAALARARDAAERSDALPRLPAVTGPEDLATAFADAITAARAAPPARATSRMILYRLDRLADVAPPARGTLRDTTTADVPRLVALVDAFQRDVGSVGESAASIERAVREARIVAWDVAGEIVSIAQHSPFTETNARVRLVYTPPEHRGHGYAAACVGGIVRRILDARACACLFADAANATSNALYLRLGFVEVERHVTLTFD